VAICCLLFHVLEIVLFTVSFPVTIVKGDCQLVYGMERSKFSLFLVRYQILEVI